MGLDIEKTREYYKSIKPEDLCGCAYCKNYRLQIKEAYPLVADYLDALGIDIEKPHETSPLKPDEDGIAASYPATDIQSEHFVIDIYSVRLKWVL